MSMRVAIALLVNDEFRNRMAHVTLRCGEYGFGLRALRLPAHVSLKQPFLVRDFARLERYFDGLAARIEPQPLRFDGYRFWGNAGQGVVSVHVAGNPRLRALHARLNRELEEQFGGTDADFDGDAYEFHLTVAIGPCRADRIAALEGDMVQWEPPESVVATRLALFIYRESTRPDPLYGVHEYGTYRIVPLHSPTST